MKLPSSVQFAPLRLPAFRNPFPRHARLERGHPARRGRACDRRQGPDELGPLGIRSARRRSPADGCGRASLRPAPRPARAAVADDRGRRVARRRVRRAALRAECRHRRRARPGGRPGDRLLPAGRLRRRAEPRRRRRVATGERAAADGREPELGRRADRGRAADRSRRALGRVRDQRRVLRRLDRARPPDPAPPTPERAGALTRPLARPRRRLHGGAPVPVDARRPRGLGSRVARHRRRPGLGDLPRQEHVLRGRLRLRPPVRRDGRRSRPRQPRERARPRPPRRGPHVRHQHRADGSELHRGGGQPERLGRGGLLRRPRRRQRRRGRLQRPPRPARHLRPPARPSPDLRDERDVPLLGIGEGIGGLMLHRGGRAGREPAGSCSSPRWRAGRARGASQTRRPRRSSPCGRVRRWRPPCILAVAGRRDWTREDLAAAVRAGDRRALARAISLVEDGDPLAYGVVSDLYPHTGAATRSESPARRGWGSRASSRR